jgi:hypothetical protein
VFGPDGDDSIAPDEGLGISRHEQATAPHPHTPETDYSQPHAVGNGAIEVLVSARNDSIRSGAFDVPGYRAFRMPPVSAPNVLTLE